MISKALIMHMMLVYKAVGCQPTEVTTLTVIWDTVGCQPNDVKALRMHMMLVYKAVACQPNRSAVLRKRESGGGEGEFLFKRGAIGAGVVWGLDLW